MQQYIFIKGKYLNGLKYDSHKYNPHFQLGYLKEFSKAHREIEELIFINALLSNMTIWYCDIRAFLKIKFFFRCD